MNRSIHLLFITTISCAVAGCKAKDEVKVINNLGGAYRFAGHPFGPRAIIHCGPGSVNTILLTEEPFLESSASLTSSKDLKVTVNGLNGSNEDFSLIVPSGRTSVIDASGKVTLIKSGLVRWEDERLKFDLDDNKFRGLLEAITSKQSELGQIHK